MVAGFHRSISFPGSPRLLKVRPASHTRSISLPCRSHPLISQLQEEIRSVTDWITSKPDSSASLCDGLARLELLHTSLYDLLRLPQSQDALRHGSELTGRILDDFLRLADAHDTFRSEMVALSDRLSDAQVALRMKDNTKLASTTKNMKKTEKNIIKIASSLLRNFSKSPATIFSASVEEIEMVGIIREVIDVTVSTSAAVFMATAGIASSMMKKRSVERRSVEELQGIEESIGAVERRSERVLRCLFNARVILLSLMNPL